MFKQLILGLCILHLGCLFAQKKNNLSSEAVPNQVAKVQSPKKTTDAHSVTFSREKKVITAEESLADTIVWEKLRFIPKKGSLKTNSYFFETMHGPSQKVYFKGNEGLNILVFDSVNNKFYNQLSKIDKLDTGHIVMGWHPHWMRDSYEDYNYDLLSILSFYSYDINTNSGSYLDSTAISDWKTTPLIDSAKAHGVKVMLTVTSYGEKENMAFLSNQRLWGILADSLRVLLSQRKADGIDLDFSNLSISSRDEFTSFLRGLKQNLGKEYLISLELPPFREKSIYDLNAINPFVDFYVLQGYDYSYLDCKGSPAPVAALSSSAEDCPSIGKSLKSYIRDGLVTSKTILAVPTYGTKWTLAGKGVGSKSSFGGYMTYAEIMATYGSAYHPIYDYVSGSSYFLIDHKNGSSEWIWYESGKSLDTKFKWALSNNFKGVGIWALGYDHPHPEIWNVVALNFGVSPLQEISPAGIDNGRLYSIMAILVRYRKAFGFGVLVIVGFFLLGLFISLMDWRVREVFFRTYSYRNIFAIVLILLLVAAVLLIKGITLSITSLLIGLICGIGITFFATKGYKYYRSKLP